MKKLLIMIAYDGLKFSGTQIQPNKRTVQGELEKHLSFLFDEKVKVTGGSRTDTFVHALEWPFTIEVNNQREDYQIKTYLEERMPDVRVLSVKEVSKDFHPQYDAEKRRYAYKLYTKGDAKGLHLKNYHLDYHYPINKQIIKSCLKLIKGEHDFASFTAKEKYETTIREITFTDLKINKREGYSSIVIEATGFLRWMVRKLVGAILAVNEGRMTLEEFIDLLENPKVGKCKYKAEPGGLYKVKTYYPKDKLKIKD